MVRLLVFLFLSKAFAFELNILRKAVDVFQPLYYKIEYKVASKSIPDVSKIPNRKKLSDFPLDETKRLFDHSKWDSVLQRHVFSGGTIGDVSGINMVNYSGIEKDEDFQAYLTLLQDTDPEFLQPAEQLAFWMNAYNALCINIILQHEKEHKYIVPSINDLTTKEKGPVWDQVAGKVAGQDISLNTIEHDMLRKKWDEPLVHACIVCASASCPNLRPQAFEAKILKDQMEDQMMEWMKNDSKGLRLQGNRLELSRIFLWFGNDFGTWTGIQKFLPPFLLDDDSKEKVGKGNVSVRYFEYNWEINRANVLYGQKIN